MAGMAGFTGLFDLQENGIAVTVQFERAELLQMTAGFPFFPEGLTGAAEIGAVPRFQRLFNGFRVHIGHHHHLSADHIVGHRGDESSFIKFDFL